MRSATAATAGAPLSALQSAFAVRAGGPLLVAGSVTETEHQCALVDAFIHLRRSEPRARLVQAPRHPEHVPRLATLRALLNACGLDVRCCSLCADGGELPVLDIVGEFCGCCAVAIAAFVGVDRNVLKPLAFSKPTFVCGGWELSCPSYPIYRHLLDAGALSAVGSLDQLGPAWERHFAAVRGGLTDSKGHVEQVVTAARGAIDCNIAAMRRARLWIPPAGRSA